MSSNMEPESTETAMDAKKADQIMSKYRLLSEDDLSEHLSMMTICRFVRGERSAQEAADAFQNIYQRAVARFSGLVTACVDIMNTRRISEVEGALSRKPSRRVRFKRESDTVHSIYNLPRSIFRAGKRAMFTLKHVEKALGVHVMTCSEVRKAREQVKRAESFNVVNFLLTGEGAPEAKRVSRHRGRLCPAEVEDVHCAMQVLSDSLERVPDQNTLASLSERYGDFCRASKPDMENAEDRDEASKLLCDYERFLDTAHHALMLSDGWVKIDNLEDRITGVTIAFVLSNIARLSCDPAKLIAYNLTCRRMRAAHKTMQLVFRKMGYEEVSVDQHFILEHKYIAAINKVNRLVRLLEGDATRPTSASPGTSHVAATPSVTPRRSREWKESRLKELHEGHQNRKFRKGSGVDGSSVKIASEALGTGSASEKVDATGRDETMVDVKAWSGRLNMR